MRTRALIFFIFLLASVCLAQNTAKFPTAIATNQDLLVATDSPNRSVLTAGINASTLSVPVADGTKFAPFNVVLFPDTGEQAVICSISVNTLTLCARGFAGTTGASHVSGIGVLGAITAWHHNQIAAEMLAVQTALGLNLANVVKIAGSYTDPSWLVITKSKVGLAAVENTALSTWAGSANITAIGTLASGTVPWARVTGVPSFGDLFSTGSYTDPAWLTLTKGKVGLGAVENTALSTWAGSANITAIGTLASGTVPWARLTGLPSTWAPSAHTHSVSDLSTVGDYSSKITSGSYSISITGDSGTLGTYTAAKISNAYAHTTSWTWQDNYLALPTGTGFIQWGVFTPQASAVTVTKVACSADTADAVIQLRNSNGSDFITSNLTCGSGAAWASTTTLTVNAAISTSQSVGMYAISGTAKRIAVAISYTTSY